MKKLIRRLSTLLDDRQYDRLKTSEDPHERSSRRRVRRWRSMVPPGHVPVFVGEEKEWFAVAAEHLGSPAFKELLRRSEEEYGYEQSGVLRIPCSVQLFCRVLSSLSGDSSGVHRKLGNKDYVNQPVKCAY
ncbi:auxin-responsive protein SAUR71-like [Dendrobium catenatum]|nr:auxin-responsive protein SAUR71-like [Dendrobium catenatum]